MEEVEDREIEETLVTKDTPLKDMFIQYVGEKLKPQNGEVNVEMCVQVFAEEFPDFLLLVAQENFLRGYRQCLVDLESAENEKTE